MAAYRDSKLGLCIDISGEDGNAYCLMGYYKNYAYQLDHSKEHINKTLEEMMSGDYENLLDIFERELGTVITLVGR